MKKKDFDRYMDMKSKRERQREIIEVWELWIKKPPLCLLSFDKGKTWEGKKAPIFPFNYYPNGIFGGEGDTNYIFRKSKKLAALDSPFKDFMPYSHYDARTHNPIKDKEAL